jgi:predicted transcriptional regulator of viral defense system
MSMKSESSLNARRYIERLAATGRYHFASADARAALGASPGAAKVALNRLAKQGVIASPARGFYVVVPPEYRSLGCLPADQFVPSLMQTLRIPYYAGLLTAAQYHGAAHQRPQQFQVFLAKRRLSIDCGKVRVAFRVRKRLVEVPVQTVNTPRGALRISTPEATAIDLVGYQQHVGGLNAVATVLSELVEQIDPTKLTAAASTAPLPWAQRLGYLLERVGAGDTSADLKAFVRARVHESAPLLSNHLRKRQGGRRHKVVRNVDWTLDINADLELDL